MLRLTSADAVEVRRDAEVLIASVAGDRREPSGLHARPAVRADRVTRRQYVIQRAQQSLF